MEIGTHSTVGFKILKAAQMNKQYSIEQAFKDIGKDIDKLTTEIKNRAKQQVQTLAGVAHSMIVEKANSSLKSTRQKYIDGLSIEKIESTDENEIWAVTLDKSAKWIEDGQSHHEMIDYLVNGPKHKTAKDGHKYVVIPFSHKVSANKSLAQNKIARYVKSELKKRGLDQVVTKDGKAVIGKVASLNLTGDKAPTARFNKPILTGLTIYQREVKNKKGGTSIKRDIMTFRVASETQKGTGMWEHPGRQGLNAFEQVEKELDVIWQKMLDEIVKSSGI